MKSKLKNFVKFILFLSLSLLIFWYVFKNQDIDSLMREIKNTNFTWVWLSLLIGLISHVSRAMRWNILIEPLGYKPKLRNTFSAVMIMYMSNYAIPRIGEVTRVSIMKKYEKIPFTELFGTVVVERAVDMLLLAICFLLVIFTQAPVLVQFIENNPESLHNINLLFENKWFLIGLGLLGLAVLFSAWKLRHKISHLGTYKKIKELILNFWTGIKTITQLERKWEFIFHSVFIYVLYFLMLYVVFFAFEATTHLSLLAGLTVFVMAGLGMVIPVPGGIGAWHWLVTRTLFVYGVSIEPNGNAFALVSHTSTSLLLIGVGFIALVLLPILNKKYKPKTKVKPVVI